jgi:hypothetical protein
MNLVITVAEGEELIKNAVLAADQGRLPMQAVPHLQAVPLIPVARHIRVAHHIPAVHLMPVQVVPVFRIKDGEFLWYCPFSWAGLERTGFMRDGSVWGL